MELQRLCGRKIVDRVRRRGRKWRGKHMTMIYIPPESSLDSARDDTTFSIGTLISSHLEQSAVKRNRMRRRCREALRVVSQERARLSSSESRERGTSREAVVPPLDAAHSAALEESRASYQLLILPHSSSLTCAFAELTGDVERFLLHLQNHVS